MDGSFGCAKAFQFGFELLDYRRRGKQAAVIGKGREPDEHALILECRYSVTDDFSRARRHNGADGRTHFVQSGAGRFGD